MKSHEFNIQEFSSTLPIAPLKHNVIDSTLISPQIQDTTGLARLIVHPTRPKDSKELTSSRKIQLGDICGDFSELGNFPTFPLRFMVIGKREIDNFDKDMKITVMIV